MKNLATAFVLYLLAAFAFVALMAATIALSIDLSQFRYTVF